MSKQIQNETGQELPRYRSHKIVWALKILKVEIKKKNALITPERAGYAPFYVDMDYIHKHNPKAGGYFVLYEDGYQSWSPAGAFEDGYTRHRPSGRINVLKKGHKYGLINFEDDGVPQIIQFIEKVAGSALGELQTLNNGTTNEAVLEMLIDRMWCLQDISACRENAIAITKMEEALMWLEKRTADRQKRNVGKHRL